MLYRIEIELMWIQETNLDFERLKMKIGINY